MARVREVLLAVAAAVVGGGLAWWLFLEPAPSRTPAVRPVAEKTPVAARPAASAASAPVAPEDEPETEVPEDDERPPGPPDPNAPGDWHAQADGPRWTALADALDAAGHPMAEPARDLARRVSRSHRELSQAQWEDMLAQEAQLLGYLGTTELDEQVAGQVEALSGAVTGLQERDGPDVVAPPSP